MAMARSEKERRQKAPRLLRVSLTTALVAWAVAFGLATMSFYILAFLVAYLWLYMGLATAGIAFIAAWPIGWRLLASRKQRLQFASLMAAIGFALAGVALMLSVPLIRYDSHLIGLRLHTRIWLDAGKVRSWAQGLEITDGDGSQAWPLRRPMTLWLTGLPFGDVRVDTETRDVTVDWGSALAGHWGVFVTGDGQEWNGKHPPSEAMRRLKVEDGVWVWYTQD